MSTKPNGFALAKHVMSTTAWNSCMLLLAIINWQPFLYFLVFYLTLRNRNALVEAGAMFSEQSHWIRAFKILFLFKYIKVIVHTVSFLVYRPIPTPVHPTIRPKDVTVILPTIGPIDDLEFRETLRTILLNQPSKIIISTVGIPKKDIATRVGAEELAKAMQILGIIDPLTTIQVVSTILASKRKQIFAAIQEAKTPIIALADDHVFWGHNFLKAALAPFEDPRIGAVGTNKRVRRDAFTFTWANFVNFIACNYLERHNFECTASVNIDQGVFVLSTRTSFYRRTIFDHARFAKEYLEETWGFGTVGRDGFDTDDDNMLTRFTIGVCKYKVWFQNSEATIMHTTLGEPGKFFKQMDRWIRTTWRSNSTSLFSDQTPWHTQPWSVYAVYFSSFVNFALFYDLALLITLLMGLDDLEVTFGMEIDRAWALGLLSVILFSSKMVKPFPHFWRNPWDVLWIPGYVLFGYYHSFVKLKALLTVTNVNWGTRPGVK